MENHVALFLTHPVLLPRRLVHVTDWLPTLISAAGGNSSDLRGIDGIDQWEDISKGNNEGGKRKEMLYNINPLVGRDKRPKGAALRQVCILDGEFDKRAEHTHHCIGLPSSTPNS